MWFMDLVHREYDMNTLPARAVDVLPVRAGIVFFDMLPPLGA
jgi:hypothetical protein